MNILAIDTSSQYLSLGLQYLGKVDYSFEQVTNKHSEFIIPKIRELLYNNGASLDEMDAIAYNRGPGSFTGLRIGLSVVLGMAYATKCKVIPIDGFLLYANSVNNLLNKSGVKLLIGVDARLKQLYLAGVSLDNFKYYDQPNLVNPSEITVATSDEIICVGNGFKEHYLSLKDEIKKREFLEIGYPNALNMLQLVNTGYYKEVDLLSADLLYIRDKIALNLEEQAKLKN